MWQMQWYASHNKMETPHQYSMSITCPARGSLPCVWNGTVERILCLWPWFLGQANEDDWVDAATLGREVAKCVLRKIINATHEISHLSHVRDATNAISQEPGPGANGANNSVSILPVNEDRSNSDESLTMTMPSVGGAWWACKPSSARSWHNLTARCTTRRKVSLATSFFKKLAKTMALGMLRPGPTRSFHTACSTLFYWYEALFFDMLGSCL